MDESYMKKILYVDLTSKVTKEMSLPGETVELYIGGKGLGAKLLYDLLPAGTDPLGPGNLLMFLTGPLTGTSAPAMRGCLVTKSPLTGLFLDSYFGGSFSPELKYAGYDALIIGGKAEKPVYLFINDETVEIRPAESIWGSDALEANHRIKSLVGDSSIKIVSIGQAGENQVPFSLVCCEYNRQAGRGGSGAVMGAKNLKAVAVMGCKTVKVHDPEKFGRHCTAALSELDSSPDVAALREEGTASAVEFSNELGLFPHRNYKYGTYDKASRLAGKGQSKHLWLGASACTGCPIACSKAGAVRTGKFKGTVTDMVEYESVGLMGSNLDISDIRAVAYLVKLCDIYGMDSMSAGSVIGFAMEAAEKGIIDSPEGMDIRFGNIEAAEYLVKSIAFREGELGRLLSQGVEKAAKELGEAAEDLAVHVKGMESPAWGPRGVSGMGLAYMTADRGACHQRAFPIAYEVGGEKWEGKEVDPLTVKGKAAMVASLQDYLAGTDTLVKCDFGGFGISPETYAGLYNAATGRRIRAEDFNEAGERIWNITRLFNLREGMDPSRDRLPPRFVKEALPDGPAKGHCITDEDMEYMRKDYYSVRGWDSEGSPEKGTLKRLKIEPEAKTFT
ncbi:MAG: aldehyde ferredoxin oxidoreductase family protein [Desulfobacteraceae bacterium]